MAQWADLNARGNTQQMLRSDPKRAAEAGRDRFAGLLKLADFNAMVRASEGAEHCVGMDAFTQICGFLGGSRSVLGVDVKVILKPPCIFCMENH